MNRTYANRNLESLTIIAHRLEELRNEITFVGGCVTGLFITEKSAPDVRFTVDVDCIIDVISKIDYYSLEKKLRQKNFKQILLNDHPICRWKCEGILVDVMPADESILGFSNIWYKEALLNAVNVPITNSMEIKVISAPYFLATKMEAFKDRGQNDFLLSHDLEDIISVLDGRSEIIDDISKVSNNLKNYLSTAFSLLINNPLFIQALPGHLNYSSETEARKKIVESRIQEIINLGK